MLPYIKPKQISLKLSSEYSEQWVEDRIAEDPSILGLGDVTLKERQRHQPRAGILDLLLQEPGTVQRYEVELQLGETDAAHIIRTIEYWDIERKRYPQYDHCAVLVAENVTSRFFNVIALFNGTIPFIVIQMQAFEIEGKITLTFSTILDVRERGPVDEDEDAEVADRSYWEEKATKETVSLADRFLEMVKELDSSLELRYTKHYIGLSKDGSPYNFITLTPRKKKNSINIGVKFPKAEEMDVILNDNEIDILGHDRYLNCYNLRLTKREVEEKTEFLKYLVEKAYHKWIG